MAAWGGRGMCHGVSQGVGNIKEDINEDMSGYIMGTKVGPIMM